MIHIVTVLAGNSSYAEIAQRNAIGMARLFKARLRVATIWDPGTSPVDMTWEDYADKEVQRIALEAGKPPMVIEKSLRGEGLLKGLLSEARETDLLVIGLPECATGNEPECRAIRHDELPLLHKAESLVLVVDRDPAPIRRVVVDYHGGVAGKAALRVAGDVALRCSAAVTLLCVDPTRDNAGILTESGKSYLSGFGLSAIDTVESVGEPGSENVTLRTAESVGADLVVVPGEGNGLLEWIRGRAATHPEAISEASHKPVLIAR
jgi:nucleotide-binding universal stress UspA family protein